MLYLLAIFLPPVAVLMAGRPIQALINLGLCFLLWVPAVIHAILVVNESKADKRMVKQVKMQHKMSAADRKDYEKQMREQEREMERDLKEN